MLEVIPLKLLFGKLHAFFAQVAKVMGPQGHCTSSDCMLSKLIPLQALDLQLHNTV